MHIHAVNQYCYKHFNTTCIYQVHNIAYYDSGLSHIFSKNAFTCHLVNYKEVKQFLDLKNHSLIKMYNRYKFKLLLVSIFLIYVLLRVEKVHYNCD